VGFGAAESWGVWSSTDPSKIVLANPITGTLRIHFTAYTINDGQTHKLNIRIGDEEKSITLFAVPKTFDLDYSIARPTNEVVLSGILPRSPKSAGLGEETRSVAVGLVKIDCEQASGAV
jgi:hypothetical protein